MFLLTSATNSYRLLQIPGETNKVGRDASKVSILLTSQSSSREHADIKITPSTGMVELTDTSSLGTVINGKEIKRTTVVLNPGDRIRFGKDGEEFLLESRKVVVSTSSLSADEKDKITQACQVLGMTIANDFSDEVDYMLIPADKNVVVTSKIMGALTRRIPILKCTWVMEVAKHTWHSPISFVGSFVPIYGAIKPKQTAGGGGMTQTQVQESTSQAGSIGNKGDMNVRPERATLFRDFVGVMPNAPKDSFFEVVWVERCGGRVISVSEYHANVKNLIGLRVFVFDPPNNKTAPLTLLGLPSLTRSVIGEAILSVKPPYVIPCLTGPSRPSSPIVMMPKVTENAVSPAMWSDNKKKSSVTMTDPPKLVEPVTPVTSDNKKKVGEKQPILTATVMEPIITTPKPSNKKRQHEEEEEEAPSTTTKTETDVEQQQELKPPVIISTTTSSIPPTMDWARTTNPQHEIDSISEDDNNVNTRTYENPPPPRISARVVEEGNLRTRQQVHDKNRKAPTSATTTSVPNFKRFRKNHIVVAPPNKASTLEDESELVKPNFIAPQTFHQQVEDEARYLKMWGSSSLGKGGRDDDKKLIQSTLKLVSVTKQAGGGRKKKKHTKDEEESLTSSDVPTTDDDDDNNNVKRGRQVKKRGGGSGGGGKTKHISSSSSSSADDN